MAVVSIGRAWDEAWAFLRREAALLLPTSLATFGAATMLLTQVMPEPIDNRLPQGPWMFWLIPAYALMLLGALAISALVLRPGASVGESLALALRRLPTAAGVAALVGAASLLANLPVLLAMAIDVQRGGAPGGLTAAVNGAMLAVFLWVWVRLIAIWAMVADGQRTPVAILRDSFAMTRGSAGRLLALFALAMAAALVIGGALLFSLGALLMVVGRAIAGAALGALLAYVLLALIVAVFAAIWTVLVAFLYRQLAARR